MNKRKIFLGLSALVLGVGGVFAGRATAKFASATDLYYKAPGGCTTAALSITGATNNFLTSGAPGTHQAVINTSNSATTAGLYATSTCNKKVFLAP